MTKSLQRSCTRRRQSGETRRGGHFRRTLRGAEDGECFFAHSRHFARDAHLAVEDDEELSPGSPYWKIFVPVAWDSSFVAVRNEPHRLPGQPVEERHPSELLFALGQRLVNRTG